MLAKSLIYGAAKSNTVIALFDRRCTASCDSLLTDSAGACLVAVVFIAA